MRKLFLVAIALGSLGLASSSQAVTINLALDVDLVSSPGQAIYTILLEDASDSSPLSINGYNVDYAFDTSELSWVSSEQLVSFGALGVLPFSATDDCEPPHPTSANWNEARCTAGNVPTYDSSPVGPLFRVTFDILGTAVFDGEDDFTAGVLDEVFNGVAQAGDEDPFELGVVVVGHSVPEPSTLLLLGLGLLGIGRLGRARS